jgi:hypothetical protein
VFWDSLERSRIKAEHFTPFVEDLGDVTGLARLVFSEMIIAGKNNRGGGYYRKRFLKKFDDGGEPTLTTSSGYAIHDIPYGERFTANRYALCIPSLCKYIRTISSSFFSQHLLLCCLKIMTG